jgi:anti-sigma B factor antagonist
MSNLRIQITRHGKHSDIAVIEVHGQVDTVAAYGFQEKMHTLIQKGVYRYIVDLHHLDYISSAGIGVFPGMFHELQQHDGGLVFVRVPDKTYKLFEMIGLITLFPVLESVEQVLEEFQSDDA